MKKQILLFGLVLLFLIVGVQAAEPISNLPTSISLNCGESYSNSFSLTGTNITITPGTIGSTIGYEMSVMLHPISKVIYLSFFQSGVCSGGSSTFTFKIDSDGTEVTKSIELEVSEKLWNLGEITASKGKRIDIGGIAHFGILEVSNTQVQYILSGCGTTEQGLLEEGNKLEAVCSGEAVEINLKNSYGDPFNFAEFEIFSSEAGLILTSSNETIADSSECVLGLDTLGAKVKRGNIFAIKTINANTGKFVDSVAVTILDQQGELSPIAGVSTNIGFFSERLHEEYLQDIIVQLEKEGCEPSTQVILFEKSYDDYKKAKEDKEGASQLVLNMSARYELGAISGTIKNVLNEVIEGVDVKITKPDSSVIIVQTDTNGLFTWTPDVIGTYKIQGGKDDYESTDLVSIEVFQNKQYLIVVKVDGKQPSKPYYKKGDKISFELRDENNTLLPLTIDATFAGVPLMFVGGISDEVIFEDTSILLIPSIGGYTEQQLQLIAKKTNWTTIIYWIGIIIGVIILLGTIIAIIRKVKRGSGGNAPQKMEFQLGGEAT